MKKIPFTVSARTAKLLGRENVSNAEGAVIELIKNSYDADAKVGVIIFENEEGTENISNIYIIDNGLGMTEDTIEKYWMTIGFSHKQKEFVGQDGRIKSGAKGIGRLSLDRLGNRTEMISSSRCGGKSVKWSVEWSDFEDEDGDIGNVYAELDSIENFNHKEYVESIWSNHKLVQLSKRYDFTKGTVIKISGLRDNWEKAYVDKVFSNLSNIVPPSEVPVFDIYMFDFRDIEKYGNVPSIVNEDYDYKLYASLGIDKRLKIKVNRNEFDWNLIDMDLFSIDTMKKFPYDIETFEKGSYEIELGLNELLVGFEEKRKQEIYDLIGPFEMTLYFLKNSYTKRDRDKFYYRNFNIADRTRWLQTYSGVKLYRDNFRVRPYGELGGTAYDWLMLGDRVNKSPAAPTHKTGLWRVRPNQISGSISISRLTNLNFEDKSNREGLQENQSFHLFRELIGKIIGLLEKDRQTVMRALATLLRIKNEEEFEKVEANKIAKKIVDISTKQSLQEMSQEELNEVIKPENISVLAKSFLASIQENKDLISENQLLRAMASTGLTITTFAHELKNISAKILNRNSNLTKILNTWINPEELENSPSFKNPYILIDDMTKTDERIKKWLDISLSAIKKDKRNRKMLELYSVMEEYQREWSSVLEYHHAELIVPSVKDKKSLYRMFEIDIDTIFNNLISNSLTAFRRSDASEERKIIIDLSSNNNELIITYTDTGPGLSKDIIDANKILEPLYTTKRDELGQEIGTGLGMWIVQSTVEEYKGTIKISKSRPGFKLSMYFPLKSGEGIYDV